MEETKKAEAKFIQREQDNNENAHLKRLWFLLSFETLRWKFD